MDDNEKFEMIRQGAKLTKNSTKLSVKIVHKILKFIKWFGGIIGAHLPAVISVVLIVVMMFNIIYAIASSSSNTISRPHLTSEAELILRMFESYVDGTYRMVDTDGDGNPDRREAGSVENTDVERSKYNRIYDFIINNNYEHVLCALWSVGIKQMLCTGREGAYCNYGEQNIEDGLSADDLYETMISYYHTNNDTVDNEGTGTDIIGFYSTKDPDAYFGESNHQYYTNEAFKACLDAFTDADGNLIDSLSQLISANPEATSATTNTNTTIANSTISSMYGYNYTNDIVSATTDNYIRSIGKHIGYATKEGDAVNKVYIKNYVYAYYYYNGDVDEDLLTDGHMSQKLKDDLPDKIKSVADSFVVSGGVGKLNDLLRLAASQVGEHGQKYCEAMNYPYTEWCAIYCGWLLQEGAGIEISRYGWSAGCTPWANALDSMGLFHLRTSSYIPKAGDVVFFSWSQNGLEDHVGLITAVDTSNRIIKTSEGNSGSNGGYTTTVVVEREWSMDNPCVWGYGDITYPNNGQLYDNDGNEIIGNVEGAMFRGAATDVNYKCTTYHLTNSKRKLVERTVFGEFGTDYKGACLVAQCIRDSVVYGYCNNIAEIPSKMNYDGYYANASGQSNSMTKSAVNYIFDSGGMAVQHRIMVFYAFNVCTSSWHESQIYILTYKNCRFFDMRV